MNEEQDNYDVRSLILGVLEEESNVRFLEKTYFIYIATNMEEESNKILSLLENDELLRRIRKLDALIEEKENKVYYYERDDRSPTKLSYDKELETAIRKIRNQQINTLAKLLSTLNNEVGIQLE